MNYKNGAVAGIDIAVCSASKCKPLDGKHNAIFETFEELSKTWEKYKEKTIKTE